MPSSKHRSTLEQWRIVQAVVDHGGYAQAAEILHRSPSSLNHAVNKLQQQLGISLLEVRGRKAFLTAAGEVLLRRSRQLTDDAHQIETLAENLQMGWEPELVIAADSLFPRSCLFQALKEFRPFSRGTRLRIRETVITGTREAITEGSADLVICAGPLPRGYLGETLGVVRMLPVAHPDNPIHAQNQPLSAPDLSAAMQLVIRDDGKHPGDDMGWLRSEQRWTVDSFDIALELLATGLGFCWLPEHVVRARLQRGELRQLQLREGSERLVPLSLVVPRPDQLGPCGRELLMQLRDLRAGDEKSPTAAC